MSRLFKTILILTLSLYVFGGSSPVLGSAPQPPSESGANASAAPQAAPSAAVLGSTYTKTFVGHDFHPRSSKCGFEHASGGAIFANLLDANMGNNGFVVNLDLPNGAVVTGVTFYFVDNSDTSSLMLYLTSFGVDKTYSNLISTSTTGYSSRTAVQNKGWSGSITIDSHNSYMLQMVPTVATTDHQIVGAQVEYTYAGVAMPFIMK